MRMIDVAGHVLRILDAGAPRAAVPIVLAADAPVVLEHLVPLVDQLAPHTRVVALEMPGLGFSRPTPAYRFTLPEQVELLRSTLDALDIARAHVAFTCINAFVAAALAKRHPARIAKLTLGQLPSLAEYRRWAARIDLKVAGVPLLATPGVGQLLMAAAPSLVADRWFAGVSGPQADPRALGRVARKVYEGGGTFCLAALNQSLNDVTDADLGPLDVETTFVWGTADRSHRRTRRESCLELAPHGTIRELDGLGHAFDVESPRRTAAVLLDGGSPAPG